MFVGYNKKEEEMRKGCEYLLFILLITAGCKEKANNITTKCETICKEDSDCREGERCYDGRCIKVMVGCVDDKDCKEGERCDVRFGVCVECLSDQDCEDIRECKEGICELRYLRCDKDEDCLKWVEERKLCDPEKRECVECLEDEDCISWEICEGGSCVGIECQSDQDCPEGARCYFNHCKERSCCNMDCPPYFFCDESICKCRYLTYKCPYSGVYCETDQDCKELDPTTLCDTINNQCFCNGGECTPYGTFEFCRRVCDPADWCTKEGNCCGF